MIVKEVSTCIMLKTASALGKIKDVYVNRNIKTMLHVVDFVTRVILFVNYVKGRVLYLIDL